MRRVLWFFLAIAGCSSSNFDVGATDASSPTDDTSLGSDGSAESAADSTTDSPATETVTDSPAETPSDGGPPKCGDESTFPKFDEGCGSDVNCSFGLHQIDCCGSMIAIGFNHGFKDSFTTAEMAWEATCPACDCAGKPPVAEDGKTGTIAVKCESGTCKTYAK